MIYQILNQIIYIYMYIIQFLIIILNEINIKKSINQINNQQHNNIQSQQIKSIRWQLNYRILAQFNKIQFENTFKINCQLGNQQNKKIIFINLTNIINCQMQNLRAQFLTKNLMEFLNQQLNNSADNLTKCAVPLTNFFTLHNIIHQFVAFAQYVIKNEFQTAQILSKIVVNELKAPIESILDRNQLIFKKSFIKILSQQHKVVFCLCQLDIHILELKLILQSRDEKKTIEKKQLKNIKRAIIKLIPLCRILYEEAQGVKNFSDVLLQIVNKSIATSKKIEYFEFLEKIFLKADISKILSLIEQRKNALRQSIITNTKPKIQITQQKNEIDKEEVAKIKLKLKNKSIKKPSLVQKKIEKKQQQILANIPVNNTQNLQQDSEKKQVKIRKSIKIVPRTLHNRRKSIHKQIPEELKIKKQNTKQYKQVLDNNHNFRSSYPICINRSESQNYANIDNILGLGTPKKNQHRESNQ